MNSLGLPRREAIGQTNHMPTHANTRADAPDAHSRIRTTATATAALSKLYSQVDTEHLGQA